MITLDFSKDWQIFNNPVTVTYYVKSGEGAYNSSVSVTYCQREMVTAEDVQLGAVGDPPLLQADLAAWNMWTAKLSGILPKLGDKFTDGTQTWLVKQVLKCDFDTQIQRYRLLVVRSTNFR